MYKNRLSGIIDVGMYNSILSPDVTLDNSDNEITDEQWIKFNPSKYKELVLQYAIEELKKLLKQLSFKCEYVENSASIWSPSEYNWMTDTLEFEVMTEKQLTDKELKQLIETELHDEIHQEFNATYNIYESITENHGIEECY